MSSLPSLIAFDISAAPLLPNVDDAIFNASVSLFASFIDVITSDNAVFKGSPLSVRLVTAFFKEVTPVAVSTPLASI